MASTNLHVGDVGSTAFLNLTTTDGTPFDFVANPLTAKAFILTKPSGATVTLACGFVTNGSDGKLKYVTQAGDLDEAGHWKIQALLNFTSGAVLYSDIAKFKVDANLI